ncbi:chemotaxis protein [Aestuariicoccus sp. MJ-SS9]|uniref:chemotaxis protein n=1 Tax=Aestuariicoccus sp. MJ-SS9 TaxID=3079855 RepID=UPI002907A17A|nr:chemotaxis protein [Aestuariicoccus sp. MJ-SS9]MDU8912385.1 chemotaxis protein [Aestuariicoccus sp. MJ-SS9]
MAAPSSLRLAPREAIALLGEEIARLSQRLLRLEDGIEALCTDDGVTRSDALKHLQEIDVLVQSAEALAGYAQSLASRIGDETPVDIGPLLNALPLRDLANRLGGEEAEGGHHGFELL